MKYKDYFSGIDAIVTEDCLDKVITDKDPIVIVIPHLDDDLYSCVSWMQKAYESDSYVNIVLLSTGTSQVVRETKYQEIYDTLGIKARIFFLDLFGDGESDQCSIKSMVKILDKFSSIAKYFLIPEPSHHQDHENSYKACLASIRYRDSLRQDLEVYAYNYTYNHEFIQPNVYVKLSDEFFDKKIQCLKLLNEVDNILVNRVNTVKVIESMAIVNGSKIGINYAESFRLIRACK
jgi:LmbE family N-acetylglucosaminyl deacetylase